MNSPRSCRLGRANAVPAMKAARRADIARATTADHFGVQCKLTIGAPNDIYEQEADRVADQVVSGGSVHLPAAGNLTRLQREPADTEEEEMLQAKCANCQAAQQDEERVQTKPAAAGTGPSRQAASRAATAIASAGQPLGRAERAYFEPRFGRDLSHVRVHADAGAAAAAASIGARAYTLRNHIAFAAGAFSTGSVDGRRLLAHEITHTLQQSEQSTVRRRCTASSVCNGAVPGSAQQFNDDQEQEEAGPRARRLAMTPQRARRSGHAGRAAQLENFFRARNPALMAEIHGIFIDADMASGTGAYAYACDLFLADSLPPGDPDPSGFATATQDCVFVPGQMNREALQFNRGAATINGFTRAEWQRETEAALTHEATHAFYEQDVEPTLPRPAGVSSASCTDNAVENELSEIVAMLIEFPFFFDAAQAESSASGPAHRRLTQYFDDLMDMSAESIPGALRQMGCVCECNEVALYVQTRLRRMLAAFSTVQKDALRTELQRRLPAGHDPTWPNAPVP